MIFTFRITSKESENFLIKMKIDGKHSFFDLHTFIQMNCDFEPCQIASFFMTDDEGLKTAEISMMDAGFDGGAYLLMQNAKLTDLIKEKGQKLYYTFDLSEDRSLLIELIDIDMGTKLKEPLVTAMEGDAPVQVLSGNSNNSIAKKFQEEEVFMDFGILDDYNELFGEMEDF
ncbi:MAG: plasmid pRiA4b ORF-3 family protein [Bacteroidales bacterium]|nr:plasmid pRiA4b ORF-3 family protein [Bacteroidales bacterium]